MLKMMTIFIVKHTYVISSIKQTRRYINKYRNTIVFKNKYESNFQIAAFNLVTNIIIPVTHAVTAVGLWAVTT